MFIFETQVVKAEEEKATYVLARNRLSFFRGETGRNGIVVMIANERQDHFDYGRIVAHETESSGVFFANDLEADQQGFPIELHIEKVVIYFLFSC